MKTMLIAAAVALCASQVSAANTHTVTFRKMNGTVLLQTNVVHGANATALAPTLPTESGMTKKSWDFAEKLACVTNDVTCWALYEAQTAKSPSTSISSKAIAERETPYSLDEYFQLYDNLAWSDEFSGSSLSVGGYNKNWAYDTEQRNNELHTYTSNGSNQSVSDGTLKLTAKRNGNSLTSCSIKSSGKVAFKYGRCEIRAKITKTKGMFPAFWMMSNGQNWLNGVELDVFEQVSGCDWLAANYHIINQDASTVQNQSPVTPNDGVHWGYGYHRIGVIVNEREIVYYVDDYIFKRMDVRASRYDRLRSYPLYILLNLAVGGNWTAALNGNLKVASISDLPADFTSEDFTIDYCRIFTNTTAGKAIARPSEPEGTKLSGPVKATVWRGKQMKDTWSNGGATYYSQHRSGTDRRHVKTALTEYFERDKPDVITFLTLPRINLWNAEKEGEFDVPGTTTLFVSANGDGEGTTGDNLLGAVMFDSNRFSASASSANSLKISDNAEYVRCAAVCANLVEKETGANVKVVGVNLCSTSGIDYDTLFAKLNQFKDERTILLFQSINSADLAPLENQAAAKLDRAYQYLGEYNVSPAHQFAYVTTNCVSAVAENPLPLSVPQANGEPSGVHTNQAFCATVQFDAEGAEPPVLPEYPVLGTPAVSRGGNGTFSISVSVSSNAPASVVCVDRGNNYPMATSDTSLPATYSAVLSSLGAGTHQPSVRALATDGTPVSATCPTAFHVGPLAVSVVTAADGGTLTPGVFRVSRADAAPTDLPALSFDVAFSGAGLAGIVPPGVSSATIPAGAAFVDIPVTPAHEVDGGLEIVMSVSGAYVGQASSATMTIRHTNLDATIRYVAEDGDDANDGVSPQQPKRTVANAVESLAAISRTVTCTVFVAPGTYTLTRDNDAPIAVTNAIRILGTGATPEAVVFRRTEDANNSHQDLSLFHLNHPDALVANLVMQDGRARQPTRDTTAGSAWIGTNGGTISNCVVRGGNVSHPFAVTPGILMLGPGLVTHCVITNNSGTSAMENSWADTYLANAVVMKGTGGRLENCLIRDNRSGVEGGTGSDKTSTVYATGSATIANCTIVENRARNCAGVFADGTGVTVRNCVIAGNVDVGADTGNPTRMGTGSFVACATDDAAPINGTCYSGSLASFFPRLAESIPVELKFRPAAGGPLCDSGVDYEPMAGVDLSGTQPRKTGAHVDIGCYESESGQQSGYAAWIAANGISGAPGEPSNGIANGIRYAFDIAPASSTVGMPIIHIVRDANGNPAILARELAEGRDDVTFGVLATPDLTDWSNATLVPMTKFATDGLWRPTASATSGYVFPSQMFFRYKIEVQ